jgi:hypothetical protein
MRKTYLLGLIILAGLTLLVQEKAFAGAWTTPKNNLWMEFYNKFSFSNDKYNSHGGRVPLGQDIENNLDKGAEYWAYDFEWKAEYGLSDWLNFLTGISYEQANYKEHSRPDAWGPFERKSNGVKYVHFGLKARATETPLVVSYQIQSYLTNLPAFNAQPQLTKGDEQIEARVLLGKAYKMGRIPAYSGFETGYRWRMGHKVADDIPLFFETGIVITDWLMITGELDNWVAVSSKGTSNWENIGTVRGGIIFSPSGKFNQFKRISNNFNVALQGGAQVWGKNTNAGWEIVLKFSTQFDVPELVENLNTGKHKNTREVESPTKT